MLSKKSSISPLDWITHSTLEPGALRVPFSLIGFNVVMIHATQPSKSSPSEAATYNETDLRLRVGERKKFECSRGGTNILTKRTLSPDKVIGEILNNANYSFVVPIAVGPYGEIGSLLTTSYTEATHYLYQTLTLIARTRAARAAKHPLGST